MTSMLVQVSALDPVTLCSVTAVLLATAAIAALVPALRASRLSPLAVLQAE